MRSQAQAFIETLQDEICAALERLDGRARFREDPWTRPGGGGGRTRVMEGGALLEKGAVNASAVWGPLSEDFARRLPGDGGEFFATGVSVVLHPRNPHVPTAHCNFRYLERGGAGWFGGGGDLTPFYPRAADCVEFHAAWKRACDRHHPAFHRDFKAWCDRYFFLPHRGEARGVGGVFFDYLRPSDGQELDGHPGVDLGSEALWAFFQEVGRAFLPAYLPVVERRAGVPHGEGERAWQLQRRGRYAEFNLLYDRGTAFGLQTGGRTESILVSLPPLARWPYDPRPEPGSAEARLAHFLVPRDWATADPEAVEAEVDRAVAAG